ncbi:phosphoserine phosphatase SerB [Kingella negevensis]|uniref:phosphoserine phosphatase SerB n=1 Tax=Kingella negevensis TaxID=1522312 RepID=UPI0025428F56|nr:phosphoserine phosphatase SerB [Kingella negevensis]WII92921.1 phosphoserine phosphatase SerB [Kingella negevensis]
MLQVLVIQAQNLATISLPQTQQHFTQSEKPTGSTWRIPVPNDFRLPEHIAAELQTAQCDFAVLPDLPFNHIKLIVSDMDSTLITIECIDEIAAQAGLKDQVAAITERAMQGELDFEQSLRSRVALLKGLPESVLQTVYDHALKLTDGAEYLLQQCQQNGVRFVLVSGGFTFFTDQLKARLGFEHAYANQFEIENGLLTGRVLRRVVDAQMKAEVLAQHAAELGCELSQIIAVGDGANDIPMIQVAGFGVAFHAKPKTQAAAKLAINHNGLEALRGWFA